MKFKINDKVICINNWDNYVTENKIELNQCVQVERLYADGRFFLACGCQFWMDVDCFIKVDKKTHLPDFL